MLFNSYEFIYIFLPLMFFGYFFLTSQRLITGSKMWLVGGSLFFYSWWNPVYLPLILISLFVNYAIGTGLGSFFKSDDNEPAQPKLIKSYISKKSLLVLGVLFNLLLLGYFKYTDFFITNFNAVFFASLSLQNIVLPLAISFFTFQQVAYLVDSYRGETKEYELLNYMLFVTFFPQLIAGPIVHHKEMMPQFSDKWNLVKRYKNIAFGFFIFSIGLFKKVVIADAFSVWANTGFDQTEALNFFEAWITSLSYTFQLYFDFSGYADMAIGAALLFNIKLPINFNSPYKATSIQDFWRRWHMTLSRFLRDYVYIPLGGNRNGNYSTYANLFATFLIGGIWHGASWMFVIWGALHGLALMAHRAWQQLGLRMWTWLAWLLTFNFINITWVFFRATDMESALNVLKGMCDLNNAYSVTLINVPTQSLAWGGVFIDSIADVLPVGVLVNLFACILIIIAFFSIFLKNTAELSGAVFNMSGSYNYKAVGFSGFAFSAVLFIVASYSMLIGTSTVFLYFNF